MLPIEIRRIEELKNQLIDLEDKIDEGLLNRNDIIVVKISIMAQISKQKKEFVDRFHIWNEQDKKPRTKKRSDGKIIEYYMTHVKKGKTRKQITASTLDGLYDKLFKFYQIDVPSDINKNITVSGLYKKYMEIRWKDALEFHIISSSTADYDEIIWNRFFKDSDFTRLKVSSITQHMIYTEYKRITGSGLIEKKLFNKIKGLLDRMFDLALASGIIDINPSRIISKTHLKFKLPKNNSNAVYTKEERDTLLKYLSSRKQTVYILAIRLAFCFCMRIGELRALTWEDYDKENHTIFIWHQIIETAENGKKRICKDVPHTKTNTIDGNRLLNVSDEAANIIEELRKINGDKKYILNSTCKGLMPISTNRFNKNLKKFCEACGIRYLSSHKIRFYGATELFNAGVDPEQIRRIMGHTTLTMTEHYNRTDGKITIDKEIWNRIFDKPEEKPTSGE